MTTQGQVLDGSQFGMWIDKTITDYKPNTIVEIGTWKGLGTTKRIIDSIEKNQITPTFISLESNLPFYETATRNLKDKLNTVKLIRGRIVGEEEIDAFLSKNQITEQMMSWLRSDLNDYMNCENVLNQLPETIDFLLLDGGEFSTYHEWIMLKDRTKIIALDDTLTLKCKQIREELLTDENYKVIIDSSDRNGFAIFIKNEHISI
jgi:hypothetical protein